MKTVVVSILALMVLAGSALAAIPSTTDYLLATQPLISGKVASVNDHMMVVDTDQGGHVTLAVDSKTMVPTDLAPGMAMRVEFKAMPDGHLYARRVTPIRSGVSTGRELAYARTGGHAMAQYASNDGDGGESLPQTAGVQPLIALLGLLALASAGTLAVSRRLRRA
jgi:hypothetical protein